MKHYFKIYWFIVGDLMNKTPVTLKSKILNRKTYEYVTGDFFLNNMNNYDYADIYYSQRIFQNNFITLTLDIIYGSRFVT